MAGTTIYQSRVLLTHEQGQVRRAQLPGENTPTFFGVHDELATHYKADMTTQEAHADPLDYLVAATGASLLGVFGKALAARGLAAGADRLTASVTGDIVSEDKILVVARIHVVYQLKLETSLGAKARRVHGFHARYCPMARTLEEAVEISTTLEMID